MPAGIYTASLFNSAGQLIMEKDIKHNGLNTIHQLSATNLKGVFNLEISSPAQEKKTIKVMFE